MKKRQMLHVLLAAVFLLQMLPLGFAQALLPDDPSRTVPGNITEAVEVNQSASYVAIKDSTGNPLSPDGNGDFTNVPLDSTLTLHYEFSLPDDNGQDDPNAKEYSYLSGDTYQIQLPNSVLFDLPSESTPLWADASKTTCLGTLTLDSNGLATITFNDYVESHSTITGWFEINGSFKSSVTGSDTPVSFEIGSKTIRIIPQTPPRSHSRFGTEQIGSIRRLHKPNYMDRNRHRSGRAVGDRRLFGRRLQRQPGLCSQFVHRQQWLPTRFLRGFDAGFHQL